MYSPFAPARLRTAVFSLLFVSGVAQAHITLTDPPARNSPSQQKEGPCGAGTGDSRTTDPLKITEYTAGEEITIAFDETIQHTSHYRVMLSSTGDTGFVDPTGYEDTSLSPNELIDGVEDTGSETAHTITVTLPNEPCEECTLQLIQVMTDKPPFTAGGDDIYYACADIVIVAGEDTGSGGATGSGGTTGSGGATGSGGLGSGGLGSGGLGSGGAPAGSGGSPVASGGAPVGSGGAPVGSGGAVGVGGTGEPVDPGTGASCSLQPGRLGDSSGAAWLGLAGLTWLALRKRRALARNA